MLVKRLTNRKRRGYFKFIGYKELVNRIFNITDSSSIDMLNKLSKDEIVEFIKKGKIKINKDILEEFKNSLVICDEIHEVYNSCEPNNWGLVLQIIFNHHKENIKVILQSATPMINKPTEIVDLFKLLDPNIKLTKAQIIKDGKITNEAKEEIKKLSRKYVSFVRDVNPVYYPERIFYGKSIPNIPYLKFTVCEMTQLQREIYKKEYGGTLNQDSSYLLDFILPAPPEFKGKGIYKTSDVKKYIVRASENWLKSKNLVIHKSHKRNIISGEILTEKNLGSVSNKYLQMVKDIKKHIKNKEGKIFIYHNYVHMSGVLFIQEVLKKNGILDEFSSPTKNTLCSICGEEMHKHKIGAGESEEDLQTSASLAIHSSEELENIGGLEKKQYHKNTNQYHEFNPVRFIIVHSDIDKNQAIKAIDRFNVPENTEGHRHMIIIGSKIIKQTYNLKAVRKVMIMSRPDNIPTLIQIIGRALRKNAANNLPEDKRKVFITIYVSSVNGKDAHDIIKYREKMREYLLMQELEDPMNKYANDSIINSEFMFSDIDSKKNEKQLGPLYFDAKKHAEQEEKELKIPKTIDLSTFGEEHINNEIKMITYIIKRVFIEKSQVWNYDDLWKIVRNSKFNLSVNPNLFDENNFIIALSSLLYEINQPNYIDLSISNVQEMDHQKVNFVDLLTNTQKTIMIPSNKTKHVIIYLNNYYLLTPIVNNLPVISPDIFYRTIEKREDTVINIKNYLQDSEQFYDYDSRRDLFIQKYKDARFDELQEVICEYGLIFHSQMIEEIIKNIFEMLNSSNLSSDKKKLTPFYLKMLYYYDMLGFVIFADMLKSDAASLYKTAAPKMISKRTNNNIIMPKYDNNHKNVHMLHTLEKNLSKINCTWCPSSFTIKFNELIESTEKYLTSTNTVPSNLLPVGHLFGNIPRLYTTNKGWFEYPEYSQQEVHWVENKIVVGFYEKSKTGTHVRFKIRSPIQKNTKYDNLRLMEKGALCHTKPKKYLLDICKKLSIDVPDNISINEICDELRGRLIYLELQERYNETNIKWFYQFYEI